MPKIYLDGTAKEILPSNEFIGVAPELISSLSVLGYQIAEAEEADLYIALNHTRAGFNRIKNQGNIRFKVLIRIEPDVVHPIQFEAKVVSKYDLVLTPGGTDQSQISPNNFPNPYRPSSNHLRPRIGEPDLSEFLDNQDSRGVLSLRHWLGRTKDFAFVASNKTSPIPGNYRLRQEIVSQSKKYGIDVYGDGWNTRLKDKITSALRVSKFSLQSGFIPYLPSIFTGCFRKFPTTRGFAADKLGLLENYKFNIVIENSNSIFTEKILDALVAGCIPIYCGPPLTGFGIPNAVYIRFNGTIDDAMNQISAYRVSDLTEMRIYAQEFVQSKFFAKTFSAKEIYTKVAQSIHKLMD